MSICLVYKNKAYKFKKIKNIKKKSKMLKYFFIFFVGQMLKIWTMNLV